MSTPPVVPSTDILWKQYELQVRLYEKHLELVLKFNVFYYAVTGALLSYYFAHSNIVWMRYALLFPVLVSAVFAGLFLSGAAKMPLTISEVHRTGGQLGFPIVPSFDVLTIFLYISAALMGLVAVALFILVFCGPKG